MADAEKPTVSMNSLLRSFIKHKASDLHIKAGRPPMYRINGKIVPTKLGEITNERVKELAYGLMTTKQIKAFERVLQIDFGFVVPGLARFRANIFFQKNTVAMVIRIVPLGVPDFNTLGIPESVKDFANKGRGLFLVTGSTGSGKSTTLAAFVDHINATQRKHIVTIEDPIEFVFEDKNSTISQRELGTDATDATQALRASLRQDPDVILVGELRDPEMIQTALAAAETGHLVLGTLHSNSAAQTIDRILDATPPEALNQVRMQLSATLVGIVTQRLVKRADGNGRIPACEVLVRSPTVERLIAENRCDEIEQVIETSSQYYKMQSMNQALIKLIRAGVIRKEEGLRSSDKPEDLQLKLSGMVGGGHAGNGAETLMSQSELGSETEIDREFMDEEDALDSGVRLDVTAPRSISKKKAG